MDHSTTAPPTANTLRVPDGELYYEVRGQGPLLVVVGAPMDARPFAPLADLLAASHTVLTTDPRGINRSRLDDPDTDATLDQRADDLARLITHVAAGPATVLGSSGGAVSALALAQAHPELLHTVIAHEPPLNELLPDRDEVQAGLAESIAIHLSGDPAGAFRKFAAVAGLPFPEAMIEQIFGGERNPQDIADDRFQYAHMMRPTTYWRPDFAVLRSIPVRLVIGIGDRSGGQLCERTSVAAATGLGIEPTRFPGGHGGFMEDPAAFATRVREVLAAA